MFLSYYKLQTNPFEISSDPSFLWMGEKHKEALATLTYGIKNNKGFMLLTGDVGSGKTTLINALLKSLDDNVLVGVISDPGLSSIDFFNHIAHLFNFKKKFQSKGDFIIHFSMFLNGVYMANKKVLLIIDEAQRLPDELQQEVRLLSNIERPDTKLINIFFVGQNEFNNMLLKESNRALRQRLALNYHIDPLDEAETLLYIKYRLQVAGGKFMMFTSEAVSEIYRHSGGLPRQINIICDLALLSGYVKEKKIIGPDIIIECVRELNISQKIVKKSSQNDEKKVSPEPDSDSDSDEIISKHQIEYRSNFSKRFSGKYRYFIFVTIISILALFSYALIFHPMQMNLLVNKAHKTLNSVYATIFEIATGDHPQKKALKEGNGGAATFNVNPPQLQHHDNENREPQAQSNALEKKDKITASSPTTLPATLTQPAAQSEVKSSVDVIGSREKEVISEPSEAEIKKNTPSAESMQPSKNENPNGERTLNSSISASAMPDNYAPSDTRNISDSDLTLNTQKGSTENRTDNIQYAQQALPVQPLSPILSKEDKKRELADTEIDLTYLNKKVTINFEYNSNDLSLENRQELSTIAQLLKADRGRKVKITGHSDSMGNPSYNIQLSIFRANIVKSFISGSGAEPDQLIVVGRGGEEPLADNQTDQGRQRNRRVELEFATP